ncbi:hypothetical protein niasHT_013937 [Heterodera trifolii]|uniref:Poly(A) polymerase RNA-binding domain-containing protein n=1 Tax=Heterodera trifolii TaxID=157864 RepID=A0ABD2L1R8_9BILA
MQIYTPSIAEQNAAKKVTISSAKIIQKHFQKAMANFNELNVENIDWTMFLQNSEKFIEKYEFYILINCICEEEIGAAKLCQFVENRIRLQLVYDIDGNGGIFEAHLYPNIYTEKCEIAEKILETSFSKNFCKIWLIGVNSIASIDNIKKCLPLFDLSIRRAYLRYNPVQKQEGNIQNIEDEFDKLKFKMQSVAMTKRQMKELDDEH